jgi:hypothetical protein
MDNPVETQSQDLSSTLEELSRLDVEWISFVALRDAVAVALRDLNAASRNETLRLAEKVIPKIFNRHDGLLKQQWESREARECREEAAITKQPFESVAKSKVKHYDLLISQATANNQIKTLAGKRDSYQKLLDDVADKKSFYEGKIILTDASLGADKQSPNLDIFDFRLPADRWMRIRITHETVTEAINGTDLIYEHHSKDMSLMRIAAIQYKIMDKGRNLVKGQKVVRQLNRLHQCFCEELPCQVTPTSPPNSRFRFPTCTAFVKATNRLQGKDPAGISIGYYVPACRVKESWSDGKSVNPNTLEGEIVTHRIFEDLFNAGNIGSRWLNHLEVEKLYRRHSLLDAKSKVAMQVQLFG